MSPTQECSIEVSPMNGDGIRKSHHKSQSSKSDLPSYGNRTHCPPPVVAALAVVAGTLATPGISSPRKYFFSFAAFMTGIAA